MMMAVTVVGLFLGGMPAQATPHIFEDGSSCPQYDADAPVRTLKGGQPSVTVTAPEGSEIVGYCVSVGSATQGDGLAEIVGLHATTVVLTYPADPSKGILQYSLNLEPLVVAVPDDNVLDFQPPAPVRMDYCGTKFDEDMIPKDHGYPISYVWVDANTIKAVPNPGHFKDGILTEWTFDAFTDNPCPIFIVVAPDVPTLCNGEITLPGDTVDLYYRSDDVNVYASPKEGRLFVQDLVRKGETSVVWPIDSLEETCNTSEVPAPPVVPVNPEPVVEPFTPEAVLESPATIVKTEVADVPAHEQATPVPSAEAETAATVMTMARSGDRLPNTGANDTMLWLYGGAGVLLITLGGVIAIKSARAIKK